MQIIPLQNIPFQSFIIDLDGQNCVIELRQYGSAMYMSLAIDRERVFDNVICNNNTLFPVFATKFKGKFGWVDTKGKAHPDASQLEDRFNLVYYSEDELL